MRHFMCIIMSCSKEIDPKKKQDHEGNRLKICVLCLDKCKGALLTDKTKKILAGIYTDFYKNEMFLPSGLCSGCRIKLSSQEKTVGKRTITNKPDYVELVKHVRMVTGSRTRSMEPYDPLNCPCEICILGRSSGSKKTKSRFVEGEKKTKGRPSETSEEELSPTVLICRKCRCEVAKGKDHPCNKTSKLQNLLDEVSPRSVYQLAKDVVTDEMKKKIEAGEEALVSLTAKVGPPLIIKAANAEGKVFEVSKDLVDSFRINLSLSKTKAYETALYIKEATGGKLEKGLRKYIFRPETCLSSFFDVTTIDFNAIDEDFNDAIPVSSGKKKLETMVRHVAYCIDPEGLWFFLLMERMIDDENAYVKIGK